jgi:hypothetical protein
VTLRRRLGRAILKLKIKQFDVRIYTDEVNHVRNS